MWSDNETKSDFLNFSGVADTVSELIVKAAARPVSIGVSGSWGVGKSSLIQMIRASLEKRDDAAEKKYLFVEFNAWLYQGYDDARAALMDVIATKIFEEAEKRTTGAEKLKAKAIDLLKRVDWLRTAKLAISAAGTLAGVPPLALIGEAVEIGKRVASAKFGAEDIKNAEEGMERIGAAARSAFKAKDQKSPPKEIQELRNSFEETLAELNVTLVVLIDDLDRCLPETTISTLEAIRLFLFLKHTAFVIAADTDMIKHAVSKHFGGDIDGEHVTNYFDKLIQIPIRVPPLGTQEVRAYMLLLFIENSTLDADKRENLRKQVCTQLSQSWQGKRVDRAFVESIEPGLPAELRARLEAADRLAPIMTHASGIKGNPRLIKRFLNALAIRMAISSTHNVGVDEAALVKLMLFERCGKPEAYAELAQKVMGDREGKPRFIGEWEAAALKGEAIDLSTSWKDPFTEEWLALTPALADMDLRGILYVSREHAPLILAEDGLSSEGAALLGAILAQPGTADGLKDRLAALAPSDMQIIMNRVLEKAGQEQEWGAPDILDAALAVCSAAPSQGARLAAFLSDRPAAQIRASIVPKISANPWAASVFQKWSSNSKVIQPVKNAINQLSQV